MSVAERAGTIMKESDAFNQQGQSDQFEQKLARWRQDYQKHLQVLDEFWQGQEGFYHQMAQHEQRRRVLQDIREDLKRVARERDWRRATRL